LTCDNLKDFNLNFSESNIIYYISGFIAEKLKHILKCELCKKSLESLSSNNCNNDFLLKIKNNSSLCYPSKEVNKFCEISEKVFKSFIFQNEKINSIKFYIKIKKIIGTSDLFNLRVNILNT